MKITFGLLFLFLTLLFANPNARAMELSKFQERFTFVRDAQGNLTSVLDKSLTPSFSIVPYVKMLFDILENEKGLALSDQDLYSELEELFFEDSLSLAQKNSEKLQKMVAAIQKAKETNLQEITKSRRFQNFVTRFEEKLNLKMSELGPEVLAKVDDSRFFYKRKVGYELVKLGLNLAKRFLSSVPALNTASYFVVQVESMIRKRRLFHQNMLMHYLENNKPEVLGLTEKEVDLILSSVYESRLSWTEYKQSKNMEGHNNHQVAKRFSHKHKTANAFPGNAKKS